jgi:hypothetical protein
MEGGGGPFPLPSQVASHQPSLVGPVPLAPPLVQLRRPSVPEIPLAFPLVTEVIG